MQGARSARRGRKMEVVSGVRINGKKLMGQGAAVVALAAMAAILSQARVSNETHAAAPQAGGASYLGFDRNDYPGDAAMVELRKTFAFSGYWISPPPGESSNSWLGKRPILQAAGFGFLVLFRPQETNHPGVIENAAGMGTRDAARAVAGALDNGFPRGTVLFLDLEEGGRLEAHQLAYALAWVDAVNASQFRAGVYCSGIAVNEQDAGSVATAADLRAQSGGRKIVYWVFNDVCPPAPGCVTSRPLLQASASGVPFAEVWQYAQSPEQMERTSKCAATYNVDGKCYVPGGAASNVFLDLDVATSPDPSHGRQ
jgi:hypothetical protein